MNDQPSMVSVQIMNTEYHLSCLPAEREGLLEAGRYLEQKLQEVRDSGKVLSTERMAVIVALNITYDYLRLKTETAQMEHFTASQLQQLLRKVETALSKSAEMEL